MKILIKQARIVDPSSPFNGQIQDLLIEDGLITRIGTGISVTADHVVGHQGLHVSPGWMDIFADFADPGYEFRETLETGAAAAAAGGYTDVMVIPNTQPSIQSRPNVEYLMQKSRSLPVTVHPIGAITRQTEGKELAEMYDMRGGGAIAFSDGIHCIQSAGLLVKALQYVKAFNGVLVQVPDDKSINPQGQVNEGIVSTQMGLPGKPMMAEELIVSRDIELARYAGSRLHFTGVSSPQSIACINHGKETGADISCSVTPYHLFFCDEDLAGYNTNLKVNPPLRTRTDREELKKALADGSIDCIATHHLPQEYDSKVVEFEYARFGMIGLQTSYAALNTALPGISQEKWVELLAINPRKIFGLPCPVIKEESAAVLTLFDPQLEWTFTEKDILSKSRNSAFTGQSFKGKPLGVINGNKIVLS